MSKTFHILVIGAGSAGGRHSRNFASLGCAIDAYDPRPDRIATLVNESVILSGASNWEDLELENYDAFVIASPPVFHEAQIQELAEYGKWIFCEKPLTINYPTAHRLTSSSSRIFLGYTYRWWPPLLRFKELLESELIGTPRSARFVMSANLADWHPWEPYQDFFMSSKELGGGALLDESHFIDLMLWFFGTPYYVSANIAKISDLEISSDDNVELFFEYRNGLRINMHLDLIGRPHRREIFLVGEKGSLDWSYETNSIRYQTAASPAEEVFSCERNLMFSAAAEEFVSVLNGRLEAEQITCKLSDGINVMRIIDAARESNDTRAVISLDDA